MQPPGLKDLLNRWLHEREQGRDLSARELCPDQPRLAEELRPLLEELRRVSRRAQEPTGTGPRGDDPPAGAPAERASIPTTRARSNGESPPSTPPPVGESPPRFLPSSAPRPEMVPGYELLGEVGRGGMGVVYKARQVKLNRIVALKMIVSGGHAASEERVRFLAEEEAIAAVRHPGVVQIHDFGTHEGLPFFALEFCVGGSLAQKLNGAPRPAAEAARLVEQVARAVQAAHEKGIVHRDLKPANVLLGEDGSPRVTDFGLARRGAGQGLTEPGAALGTPSYMAPEQAEGKNEVGPLADVYALGAILYECLTGRPPFRAATAFDTLAQVIADEPVPPAAQRPGPARPGDHLPEVLAQGTGQEVCDGPGAGGGPGAAAARRAGAGSPRRGGGTRLAVGPAQPRGGGPDGGGGGGAAGGECGFRAVRRAGKQERGEGQREGRRGGEEREGGEGGSAPGGGGAARLPDDGGVAGVAATRRGDRRGAAG
jgi:tRNA A-37 threonylcarbamoyl transferase component Bud32